MPSIHNSLPLSSMSFSSLSSSLHPSVALIHSFLYLFIHLFVYLFIRSFPSPSFIHLSLFSPPWQRTCPPSWPSPRWSSVGSMRRHGCRSELRTLTTTPSASPCSTPDLHRPQSAAVSLHSNHSPGTPFVSATNDFAQWISSVEPVKCNLAENILLKGHWERPAGHNRCQFHSKERLVSPHSGLERFCGELSYSGVAYLAHLFRALMLSLIHTQMFKSFIWFISSTFLKIKPQNNHRKKSDIHALNGYKSDIHAIML